MRLLQNLYWSVIRFLIGLRYRVRVHAPRGLTDLAGPLLILPNHPGYIDPAIVMSHLRTGRTVRPLVFSGMFRNPLLYPFMRIANALEVPDLRSHSRGSHDQTRELIDQVVDRVQSGDSFIIYPSGCLQRQGKEVVGGARMAFEIVQRSPDVQIVLVRTRGVWGSRFSCAGSTGPPPLTQNILASVGWMITNLLFFAPRRTIHIHWEPVSIAQLPRQDKSAFNQYLERWYNADGGEPPKFVPYHWFLGPRQRNYANLGTSIEIDPATIKPALWQAVYEAVEDRIGRPLADDERSPSTTLDELGLDSLDRMDVALHLEQQFGFRSSQVATTMGELGALAAGQLANDPTTAVQVDARWFRPPTFVHLSEIQGQTLSEAFVRRVLRHPADVAMADPMSGVLTYRRVLVGAYLLSQRMAKLEGDAVGLLLPASAATDIAFLALHLGGKLPVLLNWTTGPTNLAHAIKTLGIQHVVTSHRFLDRLGIELPGAEPVYLEDLRNTIGKLASLSALAVSYIRPLGMLRLSAARRPDEPAVVLFTSGSESLPKAVPLSHDNLLANIRAGVTAMDFRRDDALLGFLPPFHSFGLTAGLLMPLLTGTRVVHYPDPTDARGLARMIASYRPTLLFATPTFLNYILQVSQPDELASLRLVMTGAEKCPELLRLKCAQMMPQATMLEGYGITECSPVVCVNRTNKLKPGTIGTPLDGVSHIIVDPETHAPLKSGATGLLLVRGPTIFSGYLNYSGPDPFVDIAGDRWYNTGDLVLEDEEGFIHFRGRLKRFLKAGGEMISLPALEEPFLQLYPPDESGPRVAVEGIETAEGRHIVLFTRGIDVTLRDANAHLIQAGLRGVMRLDETRTVPGIPVLGTGKTDYKQLRGLIQSGGEPDAIAPPAG